MAGITRKTTIPTYGFAAWPRIPCGPTKNSEVPAIAMSATPARLSQWRLNRYQAGAFGAGFMVCADAVPRSGTCGLGLRDAWCYGLMYFFRAGSDGKALLFTVLDGCPGFVRV